MKTKKKICNFYLEQELIKAMEDLIKNPYFAFEDKSTLIRYCVKQQLPLLIKEMQEKDTDRKK